MILLLPVLHLPSRDMREYSMCRGSVSVKRDGGGGTELSVKITCKKKKKDGLNLALKNGHSRRNLDIRDQEEKK